MAVEPQEEQGNGFAQSPRDSSLFGCQCVTRVVPRRSDTPQITPESDMPWWYLELHPSLGTWGTTLTALRNVQL